MPATATRCVTGITDNSLVLCILGVSNHSRNRTGSCMAAPWFSVATHFKGTTEVHGSVDNPKILEMYRLSGHPEIEHDETPCGAPRSWEHASHCRVIAVPILCWPATTRNSARPETAAATRLHRRPLAWRPECLDRARGVLRS